LLTLFLWIYFLEWGPSMITDTMRCGSSSGLQSARTVPTAGAPHPRQSGEDVEDEGMISGAPMPVSRMAMRIGGHS
jgi:hypothetical protein